MVITKQCLNLVNGSCKIFWHINNNPSMSATGGNTELMHLNACT